MKASLNLSYTQPQLKAFFDVPEGTKYVIVTKGRRFGATKGAANACIEWMCEGQKILWGDTINSNIERYFTRYIEPELKANKIEYHWSAQRKELTAMCGVIDFRSSDRPENWEGFGYDKIILNEAGIILRNSYLYTNAVLPMLLDNPNSMLYAIGVPKGKMDKYGNKSIFYMLWEQAEKKAPGYVGYRFSSYDNPLLRAEDIKDLETEIAKMNPQMIQQEIYGHFVEGAFNALFEFETISRFRVIQAPPLIKIVIAVDPAISNTSKSDETGIVVMGLGADRHVYILEDLSGRYSPQEWSSKIAEAYNRYRANEVVAEINQGGDMVESTIRISAPNIKVRKINASRGKYVRAEPVSAFYDQGRVHHVGHLPTLENQMISWQGLSGEKSPDRIDALVHGVTRLIGSSTGTGGKVSSYSTPKFTPKIHAR